MGTILLKAEVGVEMVRLVAEVELAAELELVVAGQSLQPHLMDSARTWL